MTQRSTHEKANAPGLSIFLKSYIAYFSDTYGENSTEYYTSLSNVAKLYISYIPSVL